MTHIVDEFNANNQDLKRDVLAYEKLMVCFHGPEILYDRTSGFFLRYVDRYLYIE